VVTVVLIDEARAKGRERAQSLMTDRCRIFAPGAKTTDPVTGAVTGGDTTVYTGVCQLRPNLAGRDVSTGQTAAAQFSTMVKVPVAVTGVEFGHLVEVVASTDPDLVGTVLRVRTIELGTNVTARRLGCEVYSRG
jgi:hypothetical protein